MLLNTLTEMAHVASAVVGGSPVTGGNGILNMVLGAGPIVKAIMAALLTLSVLCWGIIAAKALLIRKANKESEQFIDLFIKQKSYDTLYKESEKLEENHLAYIFRKGYVELERARKFLESKGLRDHRDNPEILLENVDRAIQGGVVTRRKRLQRLLPLLASTGSTSPFIGLFGTVWGIMSGFHDIGIKGSANLAVVAPGISEALVATAMGLAAAIPAVVAYNHFFNKIRMMEDDMVHFRADFLNMLKTDLISRSRQDEAFSGRHAMAG